MKRYDLNEYAFTMCNCTAEEAKKELPEGWNLVEQQGVCPLCRSYNMTCHQCFIAFAPPKKSNDGEAVENHNQQKGDEIWKRTKRS